MASTPQGTILYTFTPKRRVYRRAKVRVGLKGLIWRIILVLVVALFLASGAMLFTQYRHVCRLKSEVASLNTKHQQLLAEYKSLTAKEVVYAKAKALGLGEATPEQKIIIKP